MCWRSTETPLRGRLLAGIRRRGPAPIRGGEAVESEREKSEAPLQARGPLSLRGVWPLDQGFLLFSGEMRVQHPHNLARLGTPLAAVNKYTPSDQLLTSGHYTFPRHAFHLLNVLL
jgi:hypothetical protein